MTPTEINIAIAEAVGFQFYTDGTETVLVAPGADEWMKSGKWAKIWKRGDGRPAAPITCLGAIPNYAADLNACAEFEKTLTDEDKITYLRFLNKGDFSYRRLAFATAIQRCEAFLRTIGKYAETQPETPHE